ncbi:Gfo/Idh/MocA family protein, partial [Streptomyces sparsus]
ADTARTVGCRAVHGYRRLLADDEVEAVYVPLPAALHADWVAAALDAGKHVLAEKPLTTDVRRTRELFAAARAAGLALMENVMFVRHGQHEAVRKLIADGTLGELRSLRAEFTVPARPAGDIRHQRELGGGTLWDNGVYPVRAALHLLGPDLRVLGAGLTTAADTGVDVSGAALLRTPAGVTAQLAFGLDHAYRSVYELTGSRARVTVDRAFTPPADHRPVIRVEYGGGTDTLTLDAEDQVSATLTAFAGAVRTGSCPDAADSLRQAEKLAEILAQS